MANQNFIDVFNVKKRVVVTPDVTDYEVFPDKEKLEELRTKIIQNLIDNTIPKNLSLEPFALLSGLPPHHSITSGMVKPITLFNPQCILKYENMLTLLISSSASVITDRGTYMYLD